MRSLKHLFERNQAWAAAMQSQDPEFFSKLSGQQTPQYLWIGCSDSRVPANQIIGLPPGEIFVHRNVANIVVHTDFNCLSVLQFAVAVLKVKHIILCGHYGCGGIQAALGNGQLGLIDNWLRNIKDVHSKYSGILSEIEDSTARLNRLCELNVIEQVYNICHTTIVQEAWAMKQELFVHGWMYDMNTGLIGDMDICISKAEEVDPIYHIAAEQQVKKMRPKTGK